jgi:hypothetical protein
MRGRSKRISTSVAVVGLALVGAAGAGGLYLGLNARAGFATEEAAASVLADMSPSDTVNLRFPGDWTEAEAAAEPRIVAFASADGEMTLFSPRPIYPIAETAASSLEPEVEAPMKPRAAAAPAPAAANQVPAAPKMALASLSSKPVVMAPNGSAPNGSAPKPVHRSNAVLNDSQIASIKRRLALTPDQERYWPAVEAELRKMEYRKDKAQGTRMAAVDMSKVNVEGLKSAGFPLVMSFSDDQRRELKSLAHLLGLESAMSGL